MTAPIVTQVGFTTQSGLLADIVDEDAGTGWAPQPDQLVSYTAPFVTPGSEVFVYGRGLYPGTQVGGPNVGASFPYIQFDYGLPVRLAAFLLQTETALTLGAACLVGSDNPGTVVADAIGADDRIMGLYTAEEICAGQVLLTAAQSEIILKRYYRLLQRTTG